MGDAPHTVPEPVRLAVFDYDGTCIDGQSGALLSLYLWKRRYLGLLRSLRLFWWGFRYKLHLPYRQAEAREVIFKALERYTPAQIAQIMVDFHNEVLMPLYRRQAIEEVAKRRQEGCTTLLVSATFETIARCAQQVLGVDDVLATRMEIDSCGRYTGKVSGFVTQGSEKPRAIRMWADAAFGPGGWTIDYAYGDHFSDLDMLASAKEGFAVTPGKTLRSAAKRDGYAILDWS